MIFLVNPQHEERPMARRMPPRYKSGPHKGQFMPKSARGRKSSRRRSSSTALANPPKRRKRRRSSSPSSSSSSRRRRRNPPAGLSPRAIGKTLAQGVKDASGVLLGKAAARAVPQYFKLPQSGIAGLAVQLGVAIATGLAAHRFVNRDYGRFVLAGGISAPLETFIVAKNFPVLGPALSPGTANVALGAYAMGGGMGTYALPRRLAPGVSSYAAAQGLRSYAKSVSYDQGGDYGG